MEVRQSACVREALWDSDLGTVGQRPHPRPLGTRSAWERGVWANHLRGHKRVRRRMVGGYGEVAVGGGAGCGVVSNPMGRYWPGVGVRRGAAAGGQGKGAARGAIRRSLLQGMRHMR